MLRTFPAALGSFLLACTLPSFASRADDAAVPKPCSIAVREESPVQRACKEGGVDRARATMKRMLGVARSKQRGRHWACDDCHADDETWKLSDDARTRFKELLTLVADTPR